MPSLGDDARPAGHKAAKALIGRDSESGDIEDLFRREAHAVLLAGPAGSGKTALARAFVEQVAKRGGRVVFCDATTARSAAELCTVVARALDIPLTAGTTESDLVERLGAVLEERARELVVLDNLEQLEEPARRVVAGWIARAEVTRWLLTSRDTLGLTEAHVLRVAPLAVPPRDEKTTAAVAGYSAVRLFLERARRVRPKYALGDVNAAQVAEIVRLLDGLPLAIELAAARMGVLGEEQLLSLMRHRLDVLEARDGRREATLRSVLESSWEALSADERRTLASCSVFAGGFSLEAVTAVVPPSADADGAPRTVRAVDALVTLHNRSLVFVREEPGLANELRYGLLETIREFAYENLAGEGAEAVESVESAYARYFAGAGTAWADEVVGPEGARAMARLIVDFDNLMSVHQRGLAAPEGDTAALELGGLALLALEHVFFTRGPLVVYVGALDAILSRGDRLSASLRARLWASRGWVALYRSSTDDAITSLSNSIACAPPEATGVRIFALVKNGYAHAVARQFSASRAFFEQARAILAQSAAPRLEALYHQHMGLSLNHEGAIDASRTHFERAVRLFRQVGSRGEEARVLGHLAGGAIERGALTEARGFFSDGIALARAVGDLSWEAWLHAGLGFVATEEQQFVEARKQLDRALALTRNVGARQFEASILAARGNLAFEEGGLGEACLCYEEACEMFAEVTLLRLRALSTAAWAAAEACLGRFDEADARYAEAIAFPECNRPGDREHLELFGAAIALVRAERTGESAALETARDHARRLLDSPSVRAGPDETRFAARIVRRAIDESLSPGSATVERAEPHVVVAKDGAWFQLEGLPRQEIGARSPMRRILRALTEEHLRASGRTVTSKELCEAAWPGERMAPAAASNRMKVAVSTLRRLGLRGVIQTSEGGYRMDPRAIVRRSDET